MTISQCFIIQILPAKLANLVVSSQRVVTSGYDVGNNRWLLLPDEYNSYLSSVISVSSNVYFVNFCGVISCCALKNLLFDPEEGGVRN